MISVNRNAPLNTNYNNLGFKGIKTSMPSQWNTLQLSDKLLTLNERENAVVEKVKDAELKFYAENGFHMAMTKESLEEMIKSSGGYHCDSKIIFLLMKSFYDYDRSMENTLELEKKLNKYTDPIKESLKEKSEKTQEMLMAAMQNLIKISPAAVTE